MDESARDRYVEALLDSLDLRDAFCRTSADKGVDALRSHIAEVVVEAAREGSHPAVLKFTMLHSGLRQAFAMALLIQAAKADRVAVQSLRMRAEAVVAERRGGRAQRVVGPVSWKDVEERRTRRAAEHADGYEVRMDADPRLRVGGRLPALPRMAQMTDAELTGLLRRFGIVPDRVALLEAAVEREATRLLAADNPSRTLVENVQGRAEAAVRRELMVSAKDAVRRYERARISDAGALRWQCCFRNSCDDCIGLHGEHRDPADWEGEEPGNPNLQCNGLCNCVLEPVVWHSGPSAGDVEETLVDLGDPDALEPVTA
jgi:hypothetical protein